MALKKKPVTGMKDMLPKEMEIRDYVIHLIKETYKTYGFSSMETPCVEHIELSLIHILTTFIMVAVLYVMGVSSIREFALPLIVGIVCGAYSSVCITGALWYVMKTKIGKKPAAQKNKSKKK